MTMFGINLLRRGRSGRGFGEDQASARDAEPGVEVREGIDLSFSFRTVDRRAWRVQVLWEALELLAVRVPLRAGDAEHLLASRRTELEMASLRIISRGAAIGRSVVVRAADVRI
jgi:hypothetical protein